MGRVITTLPFIFLSFIFEIVMTKLSKTKLRIISQKTENYFCL
nr:MAG TPA: hypothetical protein [Caudoviricetes sp.]